MARTPRSLLAAIARRVARAVRLQRRTVLWALRPAGPVEHPRAPEGLEIRRIVAADLPALVEAQFIDRGLLELRLARGDWGYLALLDGRPASHCWVQFTGEHEVSQVGRTYRLAPGENMVYNSRTAAFARGKGIYSVLLARILADLFAAGYRAAWGYVNSDNEAPIRGMTRAGFRFGPSWNALYVSYWTIPYGTDERPPVPPA